jgi:FkbM family methyltransferase
VRRLAVTTVASLTRQLPGYRGAQLLKLFHRPSTLAAGVEATVPLEDGIRMSVNSANLLEWAFFFYGPRRFEPQIQALIVETVRPGHGAIDVGANSGVHTLVMAKAAGQGLVLACEPNPLPSGRLRVNVLLNQLTNVLIREVAVGDKNGSATLFVPATDTAQAWASLQEHDDDEFLRDPRTIDVPIATLDAVVEETGVRDIDLIKIDVQGCEPEVLAGAKRLLGRDRPALIVEYTPAWWSRSLDIVLDELRGIGYREFQNITARGLEPIHPGVRIDNFFAT